MKTEFQLGGEKFLSELVDFHYVKKVEEPHPFPKAVELDVELSETLYMTLRVSRDRLGDLAYAMLRHEETKEVYFAVHHRAKTTSFKGKIEKHDIAPSSLWVLQVTALKFDFLEAEA